MENQVMQAFGKTPNKKPLKFHLELNLYNFQVKDNGKDLGSLLQHSYHWN